MLTKEQQEPYENVKFCYIFFKKRENIELKDKKYRKVKDHCNYTGEDRGAACSISKLKISVPKKIPIFLHNGSNYDYCFIITKLGEEFKSH